MSKITSILSYNFLKSSTDVCYDTETNFDFTNVSVIRVRLCMMIINGSIGEI
jgi:hypothetical protein